LSRFGVHFARGLSQLNNWVSELANTKHTEEFDIDFVTFLGILGNFVGKMFAEVVFGVFESVTPKRFVNGRFHGIFRSLRGASQTFIHVFEYEGPCAFSDAEVFAVDPKSGVVLNLSPLFLWGLNMGAANPGEPELYDSIMKAQLGNMCRRQHAKR
jgi:hypothetical protein